MKAYLTSLLTGVLAKLLRYLMVTAGGAALATSSTEGGPAHPEQVAAGLAGIVVPWLWSLWEDRIKARQAAPPPPTSGLTAVFWACAVLGLGTGCVVNRPLLTERITSTNGVVTERSLKVTSFAFWPATQAIDRQRASLGKTMSLGTAGLEQESGGTNVIEALRALDSILGKVR